MPTDTGRDIDVISDLSIDLHIDGYQLFNVIPPDLLLSPFYAHTILPAISEFR